MMIRRLPFILSILVVALAAVPSGAADAPAPTPIPVEDVRRATPVDFSAEVLPVLSANCLACHNRTKAKAELVLETPADLLKGGESGPAVVPTNGAESLLLKLAAHRQEPVMPPAGNKVAAADLTPGQLGVIKLWIDQGAAGEAQAAGVSAAGAGGAALQWQPVPEGLRAVYALGMTQDGRFVAASRGNRVSVYSLPTRRRVAELADPQVNDAAAAAGAPQSADTGTGTGKKAHRDVVQSLAFSPDGGLLATGGYREVKLWRRARDARRFAVTGAARGAVNAVAASADGKLIATGGADGVVRLWDGTAGGRPVRELAGHAGPVRAVRFSPDGASLATGSEDKSVRVWRVGDGTLVATAGVEAPPFAAAWAGGGKHLITGGADGVLRVWEVPDAAGAALVQLRELKGHEGAVTGLDAVAGGTQVVSGGADGSVRVWDAAAGTLVRKLDHGGPVAAVAVRGDGKRIASAGPTGAAKLWDAEGKLVAELKGDLYAADAMRRRERDAATAAGEAAYRKTVAAAAEKRQAEEVARVKKTAAADTEAEKALAEARKATGDAAPAAVKKAEAAKAASDDELRRAIRAAQQAADALAEAQAAGAAAEAEQKRLEAEAIAAKAATVAAEKPARAVAFSADGASVATAGEDGTVRVWADEDGTPVERFTKGHGEGAVTALAFAGGDVLVSGGADGAAVGWDLRPAWALERTIGTGDAASPLADRVNALDFSPDGRLLASGGGVPSREGEVVLWDVATGSLVRKLERLHSDAVLGLDFSWDGKRLASAGADRFVRVTDVAEGKVIKSLEGHTGHVLAAAWKRDGRTIVSGSADKTVKVWDAVAGAAAKTVRGFEKEVTGVRFAGDGEQFVAVSGDGKVRLLKTDGGDVRTFAPPDGFVYAVATGRDGSVVVAGGEDGVVRAWSAATGKDVAQFPAGD